MKRLLLIALLAVGATAGAQVVDSVFDAGVGVWESPSATGQPPAATAPAAADKGLAPRQPDTVYLTRTDTLTVIRTDSVYILRTDTVVVRVADTAALSAMREKEKFYREILSASGVDKEKLEAERNYYVHMVDSLRALVRIAEIESVRKEEANKYMAERAKAAEEKVAAATNRKKKVRPIQGVALRFYRTPAWELSLRQGATPDTYERYITNDNEGSIEFDFVTGASVMLWDLTRYFNRNHSIAGSKGPEIRRFDQDFAYDLGFYVGFGGSNLFKNFYTGLSFRFVDFFYLTFGVNIAEYQVLKSGYEEGKPIGGGMSLKDVLADVWLVNPFLSLSIDLDFLSYIKK